MGVFLLRRIGQALVVLLIVSAVVFALLHVLPGGPARAILGPRATPQKVAEFNHENGYDLALAEQSLKGGSDLVAFGKPFIANPDLVRRLRENAPLNTPDVSTFDGGGVKGYTDYPSLGG